MMSGTNNNPFLNGSLDPALQNAARLGLANVNVSGVVPDYQQPIMSGGGGDFWYPGFGGVAQPTYGTPTTTPPATVPPATLPIPPLDPTNGAGGPVGQTGGELTGGADTPGTGGPGSDNPGSGHLPNYGDLSDFNALPGAASGLLNVLSGGYLGSPQGAGPGTTGYQGGPIGLDDGNKFGGGSPGPIGTDEGDKSGGRGSMGAGGGGAPAGGAGGGTPGPIGSDEGDKFGAGPTAFDQNAPDPAAQAAAAQALAGVTAGGNTPTQGPTDSADPATGDIGAPASSGPGPSVGVDTMGSPTGGYSQNDEIAPGAAAPDPGPQSASDQNGPDPAQAAQADQQAASVDPGDHSTGYAKGGQVNNVIPPAKFAAMQALRGVHAGGSPPPPPNSKPGFAAGGPVTSGALQGPNPPGPDQGYAALEPGEDVVNKAAAQNPANAATLNMMNAGAVVPPPTMGQPPGGMPPAPPPGGMGGMPPMGAPGMPTDTDDMLGDTDDVDPMTAGQNLANLDPGQRQALAQAVADPQVGQALIAILGAAFVPIVQQMAGAPGPMQTMDSWGQDANPNGDGPYTRDQGMGMAMTPTNSPPLAGPPMDPGGVAPAGFPPPDTAALSRQRAAMALQGVAA